MYNASKGNLSGKSVTSKEESMSSKFVGVISKSNSYFPDAVVVELVIEPIVFFHLV